MSMRSLFDALAETFDGPVDIERHGREALLSAVPIAENAPDVIPLPDDVLRVMAEEDAHPVCEIIVRTPLPWAPPQTSEDPQYVAHSAPKVHVELVGPGGLVRSDRVRLGLYGMLPGADYGIRTHPAEEIFVMLAGEALWKRGDQLYAPLGPGGRSHHPSMLPHATRTADKAFMSLYVWHGDISTENYVYRGVSEA